MPRDRKNARERHSGASPSGGVHGVQPDWAQTDLEEVRVVVGQKAYRCPGCDQLVRAGVQHLVVVPSDDPDLRRHWHTECWRRELRRLGI